MAESYITKDNIFKVWKRTKADIDRLYEKFPEYERISRNLPRADADPNFPDVTDGTAASIVQKTPRRIIQQIPTGVINTDENEDWLPIVAQDIYETKILPHANEDYGLFDKSQLVIQNGLSFGSSVMYTPFLSHDGEFGPDMVLPYWGDVYPQSGKKSIRSAKFIFIRAWWTKEDIDQLINGEQKLTADAKKQGDKYKSTWDIDALKTVKEKISSKDEQAKTPTDEEMNTEAIEIITAFQVGKNAKFYSFNPDSKTIVRTKVNKDPRGKMPIDVFYGDIDGINPLGRSIMELIGPLQNLIDSDMQAYQYNRALMLRPPVIKYGNVGNFQYAPNEVLDASTDPNANIVPLKIDTSAIVNYPQLYGLQKSQVLNLVASPDTSISADVGNPGFSKTPTGINQQKAIVSVDDNAIRKSWETSFGEWSETAINLYFAERSGIETYQLSDRGAKNLKQLIKDGKLPADFINEQNQIIINFDDATPALHFRIDASTSKMADDQTKLQALELVQQFIDSSPIVTQMVSQYPKKLLALYNSVVSLSGVEDPEKLIISEDDQKQLESKQQAQQQAQMQRQQQPAQQQGQVLSQEDMQLVQELKNLGLGEQDIQGVLQMLSEGASDAEVLQALGLQGAPNAV